MAGRVTVQLVLISALVACHNDHPTTPALPAASAVIFTLPSTHLVVGDSVPATATVLDANGVVIDSAPVVWSTLNPSVTTVSNYGEVYGKGAGIGRIVAKSGAVADTVVVTVDVAGTITIDSITPHQLIAGQPATLYGHQFSSIPTATVILIGVDSLAPTAADSTHLVFVLPDTSCSPAGTRTITVKSRGSAAQLLERFAPGTPPISLAVGGVQAINASTTGCLQFAANASAATYIVIVGNVTSSLDAGFGFELTQVVGDSAPLGFHGYSRVRAALRANASRAISPRAALARTARRTPSYRTAELGRTGSAASVALPVRQSRSRAAESGNHETGNRGTSVPDSEHHAVASEASAVHKAAVGDAVTYNVPLHGCDSAVVTHGHVMAVAYARDHRPRRLGAEQRRRLRRDLSRCRRVDLPDGLVAFRHPIRHRRQRPRHPVLHAAGGGPRQRRRLDRRRLLLPRRSLPNQHLRRKQPGRDPVSISANLNARNNRPRAGAFDQRQ